MQDKMAQPNSNKRTILGVRCPEEEEVTSEAATCGLLRWPSGPETMSANWRLPSKIRQMKAIALFVLVSIGAGLVCAIPVVPVSEERANAIVRALPEFVKLREEYAARPEDLVVEGARFESAATEVSAKIGEKVWCIDVYIIVHDGPDAAHGWPWAFFVVNAYSGAVFIAEPNLIMSSADSLVYLSLSEWRKQITPVRSRSR
jgi:hypothetical protein